MLNIKIVNIALFYIFILHGAVVNAQWVEKDTAIMGSNIHIEFWAEDNAELLLQQSIVILNAVDQKMNPLNSHSELAIINRKAYGKAQPISRELFDLINKANTISQLSAGAFDISFASVGFHYNYRQQKRPDDNVLVQHLPAINYQNIILNHKTQTIAFTQPQLKIDLGGIAKGYAVDKVYNFLQSKGIKNAIITAGGDTRLLGDKRGKPWVVGIKNPRNTEQQILRIPLNNVALSTSGDYERFFIENNQRYHHILNPKTGRSPNSKVQSVSIIANDSTTADALSTTVFVLGIKKGVALINQLPDIDVIIISDGGKFHYSNGLHQL